MRRLAGLLLIVAFALMAQTRWDRNGDWPMMNRDLAGTKYSPLAQITTRNVARLAEVWSYKLRLEREYAEPQGAVYFGFSEASPVVVNGVMYLPVGSRVVALDPENGKEVWRYELSSGRASNRGVAYWPGDRTNPPRVIFTSGRRMIALNANTGKVDPGFGKEGEVDLVVPYSGAPTVFGNLLFVGANVGEVPAGPPGNSRAYDARTGAKLWEFQSVPQTGQLGNETWEGESWKSRSGVNVWGPTMTVDEARGLLFMTFGGPATDYYGGDRKGANLFANTLVAVDAVTGKRKWHFQAVHHDLWDYDLPAAPGLFDIVKNGKRIPALAQVTKTAWMYILNRETGEPVFGVEERPVPRSNVPGEASFATQPFPVKPFPGAPFTIPSYRNTPNSRHTGLEVAFATRLKAGLLASRHTLNFRSSYTLADSRYQNDPTYGNNFLPGQPKHAVRAELRLSGQRLLRRTEPSTGHPRLTSSTARIPCETGVGQ